MRARGVLFISILSAILCTHATSAVIYVDDDANGLNNGTSWENAYTYLQDAITGVESVTKPVEIRVAQGTYKPDLGTGFTQGDRVASFRLIDNVSLIGGYAGLGHTDPNLRDIKLYETILSGDLNDNDVNDPNISTLFYEQSRADNSYRVITCRSLSATTLIDGLTITGGNANDSSYPTGSGIYIYYSELQITNCSLIDNSAFDGGGVHNHYSNTKFTKCNFLNNMAKSEGGGIYNYRSTVTLTNCTISGNASTTGSGIYNDHSNPTVSKCTFNTNIAKDSGSGIYNDYSNLKITDSLFNSNISIKSGGGIFNDFNSETIISDCNFSENIAGEFGGGIYIYYNCTITSCNFVDNYASNGGGIYNKSSNITIASCTFRKNTAKDSGGGTFISKGNPIYINCTFEKNNAENGGGMSNYDSSPILTDCLFIENTSTYGGGMYNYNNGNPIITDCIFKKNLAKDFGGGICNISSNPELNDTIISDNTSENSGGGMYNNDSNPSMRNCTFRKNKAEYSGGGICNISSNISSAGICLFIENTAGYSGGAIYNEKCNAKINNYLFIANSALLRGAGIDNTENSDITVDKCTFIENMSPYGNAVSSFSSTEDGNEVLPSNVKITNCILWDINEEIFNDGGSTVTTSYCDVKGGLSTSYNQNVNNIWGEGNIEIDPCFVNPGYYDSNGTIENTNDDFWVAGDYHLKSQAGRFDPNSNSWVIDDVTSYCIDTGDPISPVCNELHPNGYRINMGTYAGTIEASKSLYEIDYFSQAYSPEPFDGAYRVILDTMLRWSSDSNVIEHEVYFGTEEFPPFIRKQSETEFDTRALLPDTQYFWRIDDIDNSLNRVCGEIWTFVTGPQPEYTYNPYPFNGAKNVKYDVTFTWNPSQTHYYICYNVFWGTNFMDVYNATVDNLLGVMVSSNNDPNCYKPSRLEFNRTYYWRIDEMWKSSSQIFSRGNIWTFKTGSKPNHAYYPYPENNSSEIPLNTLLRWFPGSSNPAAYDVYFGTDFNNVNNATIANPLGCLVSFAQDSNYYDPGELDYDQKYYWRIDEADINGVAVKGEIWTFVSGPQPDYSYHPNPVNGAEDVDYDVTLSWHQGINNKYKPLYYNQIYLGTDFNNVFNATKDNPLGVMVSNKNDPNYYQPIYLKCNQTYYWRIDDIAIRRSEIKGKVWSFTTGPEPIQACYSYPADNATKVSRDVILSWSPGALNPTAYDVYFGTDFNNLNNATIANHSDCLALIAWDSNYYNPGQLNYNQKYYWRIDGSDSNGVAVKGKTWSFTTLSKTRGCFPADTPVWVDGKMMEISKVVTGQKVGKDDCDMSKSGLVKGLDEHGTGMIECYEMTLESGNSITIINSHYFKTVSGEWKKIEELSAGMQLQTMNGPIAIKSIIKKEKPFVGKSYNLILDGSEQYFVGIDGVVALDCSKKTWEILEEARK